MSPRQHTLDYFEKDGYRMEIIKFVKELDVVIHDIKVENTTLNEESLQRNWKANNPLLLKTHDGFCKNTIHQTQQVAIH
ncbi:hypothetical protein [Phormidium sp. CCY1219]|uniref:hypothetical protein n=1 Tax=Phormidium sp. CCY1219 TaxID=2886104 RepID=UPI002D1E54D1|nr:hypothetical protein [Phormidium sp. CCY1219]MEB3830883.1 hypothetical protein [Phormidium sp. CCY1219]